MSLKYSQHQLFVQPKLVHAYYSRPISFTNFNKEVSNLEKDISALNSEIGSYVSKLNASRDKEELVLFANLISSRTQTLNILLGQRNQLYEKKDG